MSNVRSTEFQAILDAAMVDKRDQVPLPNVVEIEDPKKALEVLGRSLGKMYMPYAFMINERNRAYYPRIFTDTAGMGSGFPGSGAILTTQGKVYSFFMCEHDWDESGANHSRGWHPKRCKKCGFDASIDSGD